VAQTGVGSARTSGKPLVVITGTQAAGFSISTTAILTVVGKECLITPAALADGITITSGEVYLRNLTVQGSTSLATGIGISAQPSPGNTVTLHLDTCAITNNPGGGILLNGAAFDIKNTTVTGNGPGTFAGSFSWGGILVQGPPSIGPIDLTLVTIQTNVGGGLNCSAGIQGTGVMSTGNTGTLYQITPACAITPCTPAGPTCGTQTTPQ
jgi:hypothetical protein